MKLIKEMKSPSLEAQEYHNNSNFDFICEIRKGDFMANQNEEKMIYAEYENGLIRLYEIESSDLRAMIDRGKNL